MDTHLASSHKPAVQSRLAQVIGAGEGNLSLSPLAGCTSPAALTLKSEVRSCGFLSHWPLLRGGDGAECDSFLIWRTNLFQETQRGFAKPVGS